MVAKQVRCEGSDCRIRQLEQFSQRIAWLFQCESQHRCVSRDGFAWFASSYVVAAHFRYYINLCITVVLDIIALWFCRCVAQRVFSWCRGWYRWIIRKCWIGCQSWTAKGQRHIDCWTTDCRWTVEQCYLHWVSLSYSRVTWKNCVARIPSIWLSLMLHMHVIVPSIVVNTAWKVRENFMTSAEPFWICWMPGYYRYIAEFKTGDKKTDTAENVR